jgi:hypothetical protein
MTRAFLPHARDRLARRGRNAQHPCLDSSHRVVALSHRNRSVPQKAIRLNEARCTLPRQAARLSQHLQHLTIPHSPAVLKILVFASATRSTSAKIQRRRTAHRASGRLFQPRFTCFQQLPQRGTSCRAWSAQFSAKRNCKRVRVFAASSLLRSSLALLTLGNVVEQSTMQISPFYLIENLS